MQTKDPGGNGQRPTNIEPETQRSWSSIKTGILRWRGSRKLVLVIVAIALLLDNMLLTVVGKSCGKKNPLNISKVL